MKPQRVDLSSIGERLRANFRMLLLGSGTAMAVTFATVALNARVLGPEGLGTLALFQAGAAVIIGLFSFGTQQALIRLSGESNAKGEREAVGAVVSLALLIDGLSACAGGITALLITTYFPRSLGLGNVEMIALAQFYAITIFLSASGAANGIFRLFNRFALLSTLQVITPVVTLASTVALSVRSAPLSWYLITYALIQALSSLVQTAVALWILRQHGLRLQLRAAVLSPPIRRSFFAYAWTTNLTGLLNTLRSNADLLLLGAFFGTSFVGIYNVLRQVTGVLNKGSGALYSATFPEIVALSQDPKAAATLRTRLVRSGLRFGTIGFLVALALGEPLLRFAFGPAFGAGHVALLLLVLACTVLLAASIVSMFVQVFVSPQRLFFAYALSFLAFATTTPLLIYFYGINGSATGQIIFALVLWVICSRSLRPVLPTGASMGER